MLGFRVWDNELKSFKWPYCFYLNESGDLEYTDSGYSNPYPLGEILKKRFIPMQSTGQLDMDGKMIYEGDVISTDQGIFVYASCVRNFYISCLVHKLSGLKLIGNIYENEGLGVLKDAGI